MRTIAGILAGFLLLLQVGGAAAQTSDFEIIETYKKRSQALSESIKAVQDPQRLPALQGEIDRLQADNAQHRALLAEGLHPQTLESTIAALREQLAQSTKRVTLVEEQKRDRATITQQTQQAEEDKKTITTITQQNTEYKAALEKLTIEVKELSAGIEKLTAENTGLLEQVRTLQAQGKRDKDSIAKLQALNEKLNQNVRDRDALIIKMMDSVFGDYAKADLTDAQRQELFVNVKGNDYVGQIVATVDGNVKYSDSALLSAADAKTVQEEQAKLSAKWEELKPFVAKLYPDEQAKERDIATVDSRVTEWRTSIDAAMWRSIHQVFVGQNMDIGDFSNGTEFHGRLVAFVDAQTREPAREKYRSFRATIWDTPIKDQWLPLIPKEQLSDAQRAEIEERIALWDKAVKDQLRRWIMIGVLGSALLIGLAVLVLRKKKPAVAA